VARKPGRPREERADRAIVDATLKLFAEDGYNALSVEAVAAQAGVSKATIYRRWPGKRELVLDALAALNDEFPAAPDETWQQPTRDLLVMALRHIANRDADSLSGRIMPRMMTYRVSHPDLYEEYFERVIMPRRRWLFAVLRRGIERCEVRPDLDVELAAAAIVGPVMLQLHNSGHPAADMPEKLMDILWPGFAAHAWSRSPAAERRGT
jgi:AcrR family transcriptional regulator